ncbi:MAG: hypothetical protein KDC71_18610 [Acidobacteria bacterium]|nr:hypothetical protein [Acidobacteriota bacterium]
MARFGLLEWKADQPVHWQLNGLELVLRRQDAGLVISRINAAGEENTLFASLFQNMPSGIKLLPHLPKYPTLIKAAQAWHIFSGQVTQIWFFSPLWLQFVEPLHNQVFFEMPLTEWPLTWSGTSPRSGEICHFQSEAFFAPPPARKDQILTRLSLNNKEDRPLSISGIPTPIQNFALYRDSDMGFYSEPLAAELADGQIVFKPDRQAGSWDRSLWVRMNEGRIHSSGMVARALSPLVDMWERMS